MNLEMIDLMGTVSLERLKITSTFEYYITKETLANGSGRRKVLLISVKERGIIPVVLAKEWELLPLAIAEYWETSMGILVEI